MNPCTNVQGFFMTDHKPGWKQKKCSPNPPGCLKKQPLTHKFENGSAFSKALPGRTHFFSEAGPGRFPRFYFVLTFLPRFILLPRFLFLSRFYFVLTFFKISQKSKVAK